MKLCSVLYGWIGLITIISCTSPGSAEPVKEKNEDYKEEQVQKNIFVLKDSVQEGDLIVRLTDELISQQVRQLNEKDKSYSHSGIVIKRDGKNFVCNINPDEAGADTVRFEPLDSFINPHKNLSCALYRYDLTAKERTDFINELNRDHDEHVRFDKTYNLATDTALYCSEMIYKALNKATNNRLPLKTSLIPPRLIPMLYLYFKEQLTRKEVAERKIITIDNLYLIPQCRLVMKFPLKYFPGQP
jgi:hypothetical protein